MELLYGRAGRSTAQNGGFPARAEASDPLLRAELAELDAIWRD
jgi:hypothetical protein